MGIWTAKPMLFLALFSLWDLAAPFLHKDSLEGRRGMAAYDRGNWSAALDHFSSARDGSVRGAVPRLDYDLGAAAFRDRNFKAAADAFGSAAGSKELPPGRADYNLGNARYSAGDMKGALAAYRAALRADPTNQDARYNYEVALQKLRNQEQQQKNRQQQQQNKQNQDQQNRKKGEKQPSGADSTQAQPPPEQKPDQAQAGDQEKQDQSREPGEEKRMLTPKEAEQLLKQIAPEEKQLLQARLKSSHRRNTEKDW